MFLPDKIEEEIFSFMGIIYKNKRCKATKLDGKVCTRKTKNSLLCCQHKKKLAKYDIKGLKLIAHQYILMYPSIKRKNRFYENIILKNKKYNPLFFCQYRELENIRLNLT